MNNPLLHFFFPCRHICVLALFFGVSLLDASERPNILVLMGEDFTPHLKFYGDPEGDTPRLERLAEESVVYLRAYGAAGVCAPNRSSLITGMHPESLGSQHMRNEAIFPEQLDTLTGILQKNGYFTLRGPGTTGKEDYNFRERSTTWDIAGKRGKMESLPTDQPFFAYFNYIGTHEGFIRDRRRDQFKRVAGKLLQDPSAIELPPYFPDVPVLREFYARIYDNIVGFDRFVNGYLKKLKALGFEDNTIVIVLSDHGTGIIRSKRDIYDTGLLSLFMVKIPEAFRSETDLEPGTKTEELLSFVDYAPTILNLCGIEMPEWMHGRALLGPDRADPRKVIYAGRSRMEGAFDFRRTIHDGRYKYIHNFMPAEVTYQPSEVEDEGNISVELRRRLKTGETMPDVMRAYFTERKPVGEFYDVQEDPWEINNLIGAPEYQERITAMREQLFAWMEEIQDTSVIPETVLEKMAEEYEGGYVAMRAEENSELWKTSFETVRLQEMGVEGLDKMIAAMRHEFPSVRYWGAMAAGNLGEAGIAARDGLVALLEDPFPAVQICAARGLARIGKKNLALPVLHANLQMEERSTWDVVFAARTLEQMGEAARPTISQLQDLVQQRWSPGKYAARIAKRILENLGESAEYPERP